MATALVTGASGFIGGHLVEALAARGDKVRCLVRPTSQVDRLQPLGVELVYGDLDEATDLRHAVAGVDVVYHVAGLTSAFSLSRLMRVNGQGVGRIAQACAAQAHPPVLIAVSSLAAAGPARTGAVRVESDRPAPISHYGRSKRAGERAAEAFAGRVPITVVRPGAVFGPWDRLMLPIFQSVARFGVHTVPTFSSMPLSLIHVTDLVNLLLLAAQRGKRLRGSFRQEGSPGCGYYFACVPPCPTYADLGRLIGQAAGLRRLLVMPIATPVLYCIAGVNEVVGRLRGRPQPFNVDKVREATAVSWASSVEAAQRDLGFSPQQSLVERLGETLTWYRQRHWR